MGDWRQGRLTPEQRLVLRMCAPEQALCARPELEALMRLTRPSDLLELLRRLNLVTLIGARLQASGLRLSSDFDREVGDALRRAGDRGRRHEMILLMVGSELSRVGIRSIPLKGSALSLAVHGDPALRVSGDLDLLVHPAELPAAVEVAQRMGWREQTPAGRRLPLLHAALIHPELPRLELHWRVHWYEERFAAEALARAGSPTREEPMRMLPADELVTLILFHVRDGLSGLRLPADVSAWVAGGRLSPIVSEALTEMAVRYPALARPLAVGAAQLADLLGLALMPSAVLGNRERAACRLANPFLLGDRVQVRADASFIDILLAPGGTAGAAMRREFDKAPRPGRGANVTSGSWSRSHIARTLARWCVSAVRATVAPRPTAQVIAPEARGATPRDQMDDGASIS